MDVACERPEECLEHIFAMMKRDAEGLETQGIHRHDGFDDLCSYTSQIHLPQFLQGNQGIGNAFSVQHSIENSHISTVEALKIRGFLENICQRIGGLR